MVAFRATLVVLWLLGLIVRVIGYAVNGCYDARLPWLALLAPAMFAGNRVSECITRTMSQQPLARVTAGRAHGGRDQPLLTQ